MTLKITWPKIVDMLHSAQNEVFLIMPSIHEEWIDTLKANPNISKLQLFACIDNSDTVIRNGYGSISSLDSLIELKANVTQCPGLRISFISVDDESYFLFLESRIIAGDPEGLNAVEVKPQEATEFIHKFFKGPDTVLEEIVSEPLNKEIHSMVKEAINENPPDEPDLKRKIGIYNTLFQYAELHLEGGNLSNKTVSIPNDALPFKDEELKKRLKARINLFTKQETDEWTELADLKKKKEDVAKRYLVSCNVRKDKSILKKENKIEFKNAVKELELLAFNISEKLKNRVQTAINNSEDTLRNELSAFFTLNPPDDLGGLDEENKKKLIEKAIAKILSKINLPTASDLVSKIKVNQMYYDLTWEDVNDKELIKWFIDKELIGEKEDSRIASFGNAYKVRK